MTGIRLVPVLAAAVLAGCGGKPVGVGPLAASVKYASAVSSPMNIGKPGSFGILLDNAGQQPVTIDRVSAVGVQGPIVVDHIVIAGHPHGIVGGDRGFPPPFLHAPVHRAEGWRIAAHSRAFQLIVAAHMTKAGTARITKIRVEYHAGQMRYTVDFPYSIGECAPYKRWPRGCPEIPLPR